MHRSGNDDAGRAGHVHRPRRGGIHTQHARFRRVYEGPAAAAASFTAYHTEQTAAAVRYGGVARAPARCVESFVLYSD